MYTVLFHSTSEYKYYLGSGLLEKVPELTGLSVGAEKCLIVSDANVMELYGKKLYDLFLNAGCEPFLYCIGCGESVKTPDTAIRLITELARLGFTRADKIIALGGGVTGDTAGFAASVFLRGIGFISIPTTLIAALDSSVGGKNGVDLPDGKNMIGTFYNPECVICDPDSFFATLPHDELANGMAEAIKYGMLSGNKLMDKIASYSVTRNNEELTKIIHECVCVKRDIVTFDGYDIGERRLLNLGHTVGHAIEAASEYNIPHGRAVSVGMCAAARYAYSLGICGKKSVKKLMESLLAFGLPTAVEIDPEKLKAFMIHDKKRRGEELPVVLPVEIGDCRIYRLKLSESLKMAEYAGTDCEDI